MSTSSEPIVSDGAVLSDGPVFADSAEQAGFRASLRSFLEQNSPLSRVRVVAEAAEDFDASLWDRLVEEFDLPGLTIPEEFGGSGAPFSYQVIVLEELGRLVVPSPYFSTAVLAATAILESGDRAAAESLLPGIASGVKLATLAVAGPGSRWSTDGSSVSARETADGWVLEGIAAWVSDGATADIAIVLAQSDAGPSLFSVDLGGDGVTRQAHPTLDPTRPLATLVFDSTTALPLGSPGSAEPVVERTLAVASIALAAEQVAGAQRALEMAVEYAKIRVQFGRAIGSFQAIKHILAERYVDNESAAVGVAHAARLVEQQSPEVVRYGHLVKAFASDAYLEAASASIQVHGGIGFTWEHDAHFYFKRATATRQWLGSPHQHREALAEIDLARAELSNALASGDHTHEGRAHAAS